MNPIVAWFAENTHWFVIAYCAVTALISERKVKTLEIKVSNLESKIKRTGVVL